MTISIKTVLAQIEDLSQSLCCTQSGMDGESGVRGANEIEFALLSMTGAFQAWKRVFEASIQQAAIDRVTSLLSSGVISAADLGLLVSGAVVVTEAEPVAEPTIVAAAEPETVVEPLATLTPDATPETPTTPAAIVPAQALTAPYKSPVKYFDPATSFGWSGRGPVPKWFSDLLLATGKGKDAFLVTSQPVVTPATDTPATEASPVTQDAVIEVTQTNETESVEIAPVCASFDAELPSVADIAPPAGTFDIDDLLGDFISADDEFDIGAPAIDHDELSDFLVDFESVPANAPQEEGLA